MRPAAQVILGVVPAILLTLGGLLFAGFISSAHQWLLLTCGVIGTGGLVWALVGYSRTAAPAVTAMLVVGLVGILWGGGSAAISALTRDAANHQSGSPLAMLLRIAVSAWLILGPAVVGIQDIRVALRRIRSVT